MSSREDPSKRRRLILRSMKQTDTVAIILLGDVEVGKTALVERWLNDSFTGTYIPTDEDYHNQDVFIGTRRTKVGVIDIAGSGKFAARDKLYIRKSDSIIFVYEIGNRKSIRSVRSYFNKVQNLLRYKPIVLTVAGTKIDKYDETGYNDDLEIGEDYFPALRNPPKQFLTSAKTNVQVKDLFEHAVEHVPCQLFPIQEKFKASRQFCEDDDEDDEDDEDERQEKCCTIL